MINMLREGIKFSIQRVYFLQSYFESRHYGKRFNNIGKFKSLTFQLRAIYFHTFVVDMSVCTYIRIGSITKNLTQTEDITIPNLNNPKPNTNSLLELRFQSAYKR